MRIAGTIALAILGALPLERGEDVPGFIELPDGTIRSQGRVVLDNASDEPQRYTIALVSSPEAVLRSDRVSTVEPRRAMALPLFVDMPRERFREGSRRVYVQVTSSDGYHRIVTVTLAGPHDGVNSSSAAR
jgi:hypothetical protein